MNTTIEADILAKGMTAPRITPDDIQENILSAYSFTAFEAADNTLNCVRRGDEVNLSLLTICVLVLKNGFTVTGTSACASPENFDAAIGKKIARKDAEAQVWRLMGYALKERLAAASA